MAFLRPPLQPRLLQGVALLDADNLVQIGNTGCEEPNVARGSETRQDELVLHGPYGRKPAQEASLSEPDDWMDRLSPAYPEHMLPQRERAPHVEACTSVRYRA